jgi:tetratricopeptide (TPR) repeat protein
LTGQTSLNQLSNDISNNALLIYETDKDDALLLSRQALVADPSNAYAWAVAGNILRKNKGYKEAENFFKKSLELNPLLKEGLYWGAENNISLDQLDEANRKLKILINSCSGCNESVMLKLSLDKKKAQTNSNDVSTKDKLDE